MYLPFNIVDLYLFKYWRYLFLHMASSYCHLPESISYKTANEVPQFFLLWRCLNFSLILMDSFARYRVLHGLFFSFSTLNISSPCLIDSKISDEKWIDNLVEGLFYTMSCPSLSAFRILCLLLVLIGCLQLFHCRSLSLSYLEFIELLGFMDSCLSSKLVSFCPLVLQIFILLSSLSSSSKTHIICMLDHLVSFKFLRLCSLF